MAATTYQYFNSSVGLKQLSNFWACDVTYAGLEFPSTEHVYQYERLRQEDSTTRPDDWIKGGKYSMYETLKTDFNKKERSVGHWRKRNAIGIVAKVAANSLRSKTRAGPEKNVVLWRNILRAKMRCNPVIMQLLVGTGSKTLIEYSRSIHTKELTEWTKNPWVGHVDPTTGLMYGLNWMGDLMMQVRSMISRTKYIPFKATATEPAKRRTPAKPVKCKAEPVQVIGESKRVAIDLT